MITACIGNGFSPSCNWFRFTKNGCLCSSRCFKPEFAHNGEQVSLLKWLRKRCSKQCTRFAHVGAAISADSDDRRARIFVVGAFDVPGCALAINYGRRLGWLKQSEYEVVAHQLAYEDPSKCNQTLQIRLDTSMNSRIFRYATDFAHGNANGFGAICHNNTSTTKSAE
jgi:hypothetical protein